MHPPYSPILMPIGLIFNLEKAISSTHITRCGNETFFLNGPCIKEYQASVYTRLLSMIEETFTMFYVINFYKLLLKVNLGPPEHFA